MARRAPSALSATARPLRSPGASPATAAPIGCQPAGTLTLRLIAERMKLPAAHALAPSKAATSALVPTKAVLHTAQLTFKCSTFLGARRI